MSGVGNNGNKTKKVKKPSQAEIFALAKAKKNAEKGSTTKTKGPSANEAAAERAYRKEQANIKREQNERARRKQAKGNRGTFRKGNLGGSNV